MSRRRKKKEKFYSQCGQDSYLNKKIFKNYKNGLFVDVGAYDGIIYNNTLYFEKNHNWKGINIEPNNHVFEKLQLNRPDCINIQKAISDLEEEQKFISVIGGPEMISGLVKNYDPRHEKRLNHELSKDGGEKKIINITTRRLETILEENNIKKIDYLSIDVEGAEMSVIKSINFDKVFIDIIGFENNYPDSSSIIVEYLKNKDYLLCDFKGYDIFMIHSKSMHLNNYNK